MALNCALIADDKTILNRLDDRIIASVPSQLSGKIEARHVGILNANPADPTALALCVDLDHVEPDRLPPHRNVTFLDVQLPLIWGKGRDHLAYMILQYLKRGRSA